MAGLAARSGLTARGFTPFHRAGSGPPLVCLHGFLDTWRTWELVLPRLERHHDVLAPTLTGHAGGPPIGGELTSTTLADAVERMLDEAGFETAHLVGNSLGGHVALQLAARGRARSVVAFSPAGGWNPDDPSLVDVFDLQSQFADGAPAARYVVGDAAHIPAGLLEHQMLAVRRAQAEPMIAFARDADWRIDVERITCPLRIVWGTEDQLLPWPRAAAEFRRRLPHADWVELDGVGHCPQLELPLEAAQLILGFTD